MKLLPFKKQNKLKEEDASLNGSFQWRKPQVVIPTSLQQHLSLLGFEHLDEKPTSFVPTCGGRFWLERKGEFSCLLALDNPLELPFKMHVTF